MTDVFDTLVGPEARIVSVTPDMAERWLGKNTKNRNVRQPIVNRYAADMKAGRWTLDSTEPVSHGEILEIVENNPLVLHACEYVTTLSLRRVPPAALAYSYYRLCRINPDDADQFFRAWSSLANLPEGSPILALARRVGQSEGRLRGLAIRKELVAVIFLAWNAWRKGEKRSIIRIPRRVDGSLSFPEPV